MVEFRIFTPKTAGQNRSGGYLMKNIGYIIRWYNEDNNRVLSLRYYEDKRFGGTLHLCNAIMFFDISQAEKVITKIKNIRQSFKFKKMFNLYVVKCFCAKNYRGYMVPKRLTKVDSNEFLTKL